MTLDHLCPPQAHQGNWPTPPQNSILAPPLSPCQTADPLASLKPLVDSSADLTALPMKRSSREQVPVMTCSSDSDEAEDRPVRKTVKRKKKRARKIPESTDNEKEVVKGGECSKSKPASCHLYSKPPTMPSGLTKEKIPNLTKEKIPNLTKEKIQNLTKEKIPNLTKEKIHKTLCQKLQALATTIQRNLLKIQALNTRLWKLLGILATTFQRSSYPLEQDQLLQTHLSKTQPHLGPQPLHSR